MRSHSHTRWLLLLAALIGGCGDPIAKAAGDLASGDPARMARASDVLSKPVPATWLALEPHLESENPAVRAAAVRVVGRRHDKALVEVVRRRAYDHDPSVREAAAWAFGEIGDPEALTWLEIEAPSDSSPAVAAAAKEAAAKVRGSAWSHFLKAYRVGDSTVEAVEAIYAVGVLGDARAVDELRQIYRADSRGEVQQAVLWALGDIGSPDAVAFARGELSSPIPEARTAAIHVMRQKKDAAAVPALARILVGDASKGNRVGAARALGAIGGPEALKALQEAQGRVKAASEKEDEVASECRLALEEIKRASPVAQPRKGDQRT